MNKTLEKAIKVLKTTTEQQGTEDLFDGELYCALGVVCRDVLGLTATMKKKENRCYQWEKDGLPVDAYVEARAVLPDWSVGLIWGLNDQGRTFKEIAEILETRMV